MPKIDLKEWAAIAEIIGTIAVIVSLLFVAQSLDRNTAAISATSTAEITDALREVELSVLNNPALLNVVVKGRDEPDSLSDLEREQYTRYVGMYIDEWEKIDSRERLGLIQPVNLEGWHPYFESWLIRHVSPEMWEEIRWNYGDSNIAGRVDAVFSK